MLRITRLSDYAVALLTTMATREEHAFSARAAAESTGLPLPAVSKILKLLAGQRIVVSHRGAQGGYRLGRQAAQIALTDVIDAIEGPFALTQCNEESTGSSGCQHEERCGVRSSWTRVNGVVRRALASVTIADMLAHGPRGLVPLRLGRARVPAFHPQVPAEGSAEARPVQGGSPTTDPMGSAAESPSESAGLRGSLLNPDEPCHPSPIHG